MVLEIVVPVPPSGGAFDPEEFFLFGWDIVVHRLHVDRFGHQVILDLIDEGGCMDALGRDPGTQLEQTKPCLQPYQLIQLGHLLHGDPITFEVAFHDCLWRDGLGSHQTTNVAVLEELREFVHGPQGRGATQTTAEKSHGHVFGVRSTAGVDDRSDHVASFVPPGTRRAGVCGSAVTEIAQVVGQHVVTGVVKNLVVGNKVHFDVVPRGAEDGPPGFNVRRHAGPGKSHGVVGDDEFVRGWARDEPPFERDPVVGREKDVFVFETDFGRVVHDGRARHVSHRFGIPLQDLLDLGFAFRR